MAITKRPTQPILFPLPEHLARGVAYKVKDGDDWHSVALAHKVDVAKLIAFNFKTNHPDEVNWYLYEKVGCRLETRDKKNYRFSSNTVPGIIYIPKTPAPAPPRCAFDIRDAVAIEGEAAARTRILSSEVASRFVRTVGAVGRRGRFIPTILDNKYWFAKLYEVVTIHEIGAARTFREPAFVLHFIPIFYDLYFQALENWTKTNRAAVSRLWTVHFTRAGRPNNDSAMGWANGVEDSIVTAVTAHIVGDMATALERAYRSYVAKYCLDPPPPFENFREDFFAMSDVFSRAQVVVVRHIAELGPFPEAAVALGQSLGAGLGAGDVRRMRTDAWAEAQRRLGQ